MPFLWGLGGFLAASLVARAYRFRTGIWVPGWTGGISLLVLFIVFFIMAIGLGAPPWFESLFFAVVGVHVGCYIQLARLKVEGRWWQVWR